MKKITLAGVMSTLIFIPTIGAAEVITYNYTASVSSITGNGSVMSDNFSIGDLITGEFSYDTAVSASFSSSSGFYNQSAPQSFTASLNGNLFSNGSFYRLQTTEAGCCYDRLEVTTFNPENPLALDPGFRINAMGLDFKDTMGTILDGLSLPSALSLGAWSSAVFELQSANPQNFVDSELFASLTSLEVSGTSSVPEPHMLGLLGLGVLSLHLRQKQRFGRNQLGRITC